MVRWLDERSRPCILFGVIRLVVVGGVPVRVVVRDTGVVWLHVRLDRRGNLAGKHVVARGWIESGRIAVGGARVEIGLVSRTGSVGVGIEGVAIVVGHIAVHGLVFVRILGVSVDIGLMICGRVHPVVRLVGVQGLLAAHIGVGVVVRG